jgi:hypothetical protein
MAPPKSRTHVLEDMRKMKAAMEQQQQQPTQTIDNLLDLDLSAPPT